MEQEKRGPGRPPKAEGLHRVFPITVGFTQEEKEALSVLAVELKMPRAKLLREALKATYPELGIE